MHNLESVVLPLAESRALVEAGIVLETALVWVPAGEFDEYEVGENGEPVLMEKKDTLDEDDGPMYDFTPAPVLSELLDAIRAKVGNPLDERTIILAMDGHREVTCRAEVRYERSEKTICKIAYNDTDLLAAAALLMEVSK